MGEVTIRDLRNHGGDVIDRVLAGERITITRDGRPVAELRPLDRTPLPLEVLREHWSRLPRLDPDRLRRDIDAILDTRL
jgi:prevent-host-death family protein